MNVEYLIPKKALVIESFGFEDRKKREEFLSFPFKIYNQPPLKNYWVPPLQSEIRDILDPSRNPFWRHAQGIFFLARDSAGVARGRLMAIIDTYHNEIHRDDSAFFGFFECLNERETAQTLFQAAEKWAKSNRMQRLRGPLNPSMNDECGFLLEGFYLPSRIGMPYTPPYYLELAEKCGYQKAKDLFAWWMPAGVPLPERVRKIVERVKKREKLTVRRLNMKKFEKEVKILKEIYNQAWEKNWGFVPMTDEEFEWAAEKFKPIAWPDMIHILEVEDRPVACSIVLPDYHQVLKRLNGRITPWNFWKFFWYGRKINEVRLMALGILPEYRGKGLDAVLYAEALASGTRRGIRGGELSWTLEDNHLIHEGIQAMGGVLEKKYRIVEKSL